MITIIIKLYTLITIINYDHYNVLCFLYLISIVHYFHDIIHHVYYGIYTMFSTILIHDNTCVGTMFSILFTRYNTLCLLLNEAS